MFGTKGHHLELNRLGTHKCYMLSLICWNYIYVYAHICNMYTRNSVWRDSWLLEVRRGKEDKSPGFKEAGFGSYCVHTLTNILFEMWTGEMGWGIYGNSLLRLPHNFCFLNLTKRKSWPKYHLLLVKVPLPIILISTLPGPVQGLKSWIRLHTLSFVVLHFLESAAGWTVGAVPVEGASLIV